MSTYILQKDLPNIKSGSLFTPCSDDKNNEMYISFNEKEEKVELYKEYVEDNYVWFKINK